MSENLSLEARSRCASHVAVHRAVQYTAQVPTCSEQLSGTDFSDTHPGAWKRRFILWDVLRRQIEFQKSKNLSAENMPVRAI